MAALMRGVFSGIDTVSLRDAHFIYVAKLALMKLETSLGLIAQEHCNFL